MNLTRIKCRRCSGTGMTPHGRVHCGVPGTCFLCNGAGEIFKSRFAREFGPSPGQFYGITMRVYLGANNPNNGVFKRIASERQLREDQTHNLDEIVKSVVWADTRGRYRILSITDAEAEIFYVKYGTQVRVRGPEATFPEDRQSNACY